MQEETSAGFQRMDGFVQLLPRGEDGHWYVIVTQAQGLLLDTGVLDLN